MKETSNSAPFQFDNPTDVAVAANGDLYVVDGYGSQIVSRFDKNFKHIKTISGPGKEHGKFKVCHGVWVSTLRQEPELYIADRVNDRLEVYSLDMEYKRSDPGFPQAVLLLSARRAHLRAGTRRPRVDPGRE